ncbi:MAG: HEAT repeat domain-containing protein [Verrucomicrobia bacterium]|nr:HEAT repeat domain-containing protein [Verrucomicrobiota bacterium]
MNHAKPKLVLGAAVILALLLVIGSLPLTTPRYDGKTAQEWFREAVEQDSSRIRRGSDGAAAGPIGPLTAYAKAFRTMGKPAIDLVVDECLRKPPVLVTWYERTVLRWGLRRFVSLPVYQHSVDAARVNTARRLLLAIGQPAMPQLIVRTHSSDPSTRAQAAGLLGGLGPGNEPAHARLLELLNDPAYEVIYSALEVLWMTMPESDAPAARVIPFLTHTNDRVRVEASYLVGCLPALPAEAITPLLAALADPNHVVCANAARALGSAGVRSQECLQQLEMLLDSPAEVTRFRAAEALARLCNREDQAEIPRLDEVLEEAEQAQDPYCRLMALNARLARGEVHAVAVPMIETCHLILLEMAPYERREALEAIRRLVQQSAKPYHPMIEQQLSIGLVDLNGYVRHLTTNTLEILKQP